MKTIVVKDANILIDCATIEVLQAVLSLDYAFMTTDLVFEEITEPHQREAVESVVKSKLLRIVPLAPEEVLLVEEKTNKHKRLSLEDCSILYLCEREQAIALTGDAALRKVMSRHQIEVHGMLWLLDELVALNILSESVACSKLRLLQSLNTRLPQLEMNKRIRAWCKAPP